MNRDEAKKILALYRSEELDGGAEGVREALDLVEKDPELRGWFAQSKGFHAAVGGALQSIPVPADLRGRILAGRKVVPLWKRREFLAAAASVAVLASAGILWARRGASDKSLARFEARMMDYAVRAYGMDILSNDPKEVREYLAGKAAPSDFSLPAKLAAQPVIGGAKLNFQNQPVAMMCFKVKGKTAYLFVIEATDVGGKKLSGTQFGSYEPLSNAVWTADGKVYVLGAEMAEKELRELLGETG